MKKITSLVLVLVMMAIVICGCSQNFAVKVDKNGSCSIKITTAIPVETMEELLATGEATEESLDGMKIKKVNGVECYVEEISKKFSSVSKANAYMLDEEEVGYFKTFKLSKVGFYATLIDGMKDAFEMYGDAYSVKLQFSWPYIITYTNGTLSDDKKTVTFDLADSEKIYAYTVKSSKTKEVYFEKDYVKTPTSVHLDWNDVKGATKYIVRYKSGSSWKSVTTTKSSATITGLKTGTKYQFKVTAITKKCNLTSMVIKVSTPKTISATVKSTTKTSIKLGWNRDKNADGYIVYQRTSPKAEWKQVKVISSNSTTSFTAKNLKKSSKYYFKVVSYSKENGKTVKSYGKALSTKTK
ncbi:MAG: fibronectin type III domain-containing protein [Clostridia bacterium]|nr:fibronectin type III domain-containing protein [Clostridia bacterium]